MNEDLKVGTNWKGEIAGKSAKHKYLDSHYGKPRLCEKCNRTNQKRYDWALVHGKEYSHNRADYLRLCRSCHHRYDKKVNNKGERCHWAKLTIKQVLEIRKRKVSRTDTKILADEFGISTQHVREICRGTTWRHIWTT